MTDRSGRIVQCVVGKCPACGGTTESAEGLDGLRCGGTRAGSHSPVDYEPYLTFYEEEAETWEESA